MELRSAAWKLHLIYCDAVHWYFDTKALITHAYAKHTKMLQTSLIISNFLRNIDFGKENQFVKGYLMFLFQHFRLLCNVSKNSERLIEGRFIPQWLPAAQYCH